MDLRIFTEPQQGATYADLRHVATAADELGFDAFFRSDHYQRIEIPGADKSARGTSDAWTTLAALARDTSRVRLGTLVSPGTFRLPGPLAISVANVDGISGGRVELNLGAGWFESEHAAYGIPYPGDLERFDRFVEQVEIIDGLWTTPAGKTYSFDGRYYQLAESPALPKPVQSPRPPIILGGRGRRRSAQLAARYANECNVAFDRASTKSIFDRVREAADAIGRALVYSAAEVLRIGRNEAELARRAERLGRDLDELRRSSLAGTPAEIVDRIGEYADAGASRMYLQLLDLSDVEQLELTAAEVMPQL